MPVKRMGQVLPQEESISLPTRPSTPAQVRARVLKGNQRRKALIEILDNISSAREFVGGMNFVEFLSDRKTKYAVIMCLTIIGKQLRFIPPVERKRIPNVPWRAIQSTIRIASQQEWGVVERLIWETLEDDLPALKRTIELIIKQEFFIK